MDTNWVKNLIRVGRVSQVDGAACTARVVFNDADESVSYDLPILQPCAKDNAVYSLPDIDTQVVCIFLPNASGKGLNAGYIVGACYSTEDVPQENNTDAKSLRFADGSFIRYEAGNIEIHATGNVVITGTSIRLN